MERKPLQDLGIALVAAGAFGLIVALFSSPLYGFIAAIGLGSLLAIGDRARLRRSTSPDRVTAAVKGVIGDFGFRRPRDRWRPWRRQDFYEHPERERAQQQLDAKLALLEELIQEGGSLYDDLGFGDLTEEQYQRWLAKHGAWRERVNDLPGPDRIQAFDYGGLNEGDPENERDLRPARSRIDRIVLNLRRLYDEYHRGLR